MMPDWSDWPDVYANQETDVSSSGDPYPFPWVLHDNTWEPVFINWLNEGTETNIEYTFDNGWLMDLLDSDYLWEDQSTSDRGIWEDTDEEVTDWTEIHTSGGMWKATDKEDTDWDDTTKGTTEWQKKDYWQ